MRSDVLLIHGAKDDSRVSTTLPPKETVSTSTVTNLLHEQGGSVVWGHTIHSRVGPHDTQRFEIR
jgi:hypothetical protein